MLLARNGKLQSAAYRWRRSQDGLAVLKEETARLGRSWLLSAMAFMDLRCQRYQEALAKLREAEILDRKSEVQFPRLRTHRVQIIANQARILAYSGESVEGLRTYLLLLSALEGPVAQTDGVFPSGLALPPAVQRAAHRSVAEHMISTLKRISMPDKSAMTSMATRTQAAAFSRFISNKSFRDGARVLRTGPYPSSPLWIYTIVCCWHSMKSATRCALAAFAAAHPELKEFSQLAAVPEASNESPLSADNN